MSPTHQLHYIYYWAKYNHGQLYHFLNKSEIIEFTILKTINENLQPVFEDIASYQTTRDALSQDWVTFNYLFW